MPELPEVETVRRGIEAQLCGQRITGTIVRNGRLRWPVDPTLPTLLSGAKICAVKRRAKYLLIETDRGQLMVHLGMSGRLYFVDTGTAVAKHDHLDWQLSNGMVLRYTDPRRFGSVHWLAGKDSHALLDNLGPEPLSEEVDGDYLYRRSRKRTAPIKSYVMDGRIVVGVGNIYANEALFRAGIRPTTAAGRISKPRYTLLVAEIQSVLREAIAQGGTTLKDFVGGDGKPGYFKQELAVYGRGGLPCLRCNTPLKELRLAQRTTVFCSHCQRP
ncbi:MAG: formamidopyrimidine-DNA glycosylase [Bermanella sp.]|jgi:formamidopyrimidine-DNA glycosylase